MADDDDPKAGELVTANYGWTKPTVGASDDQWGGLLNADLDGIDSVVHGIDTRPAYVLPVASTTVLGGAKVDGTTIHAAADGTLSGTPSSGPPVTISAMAPASPQVGALWWDSVGGQLYTFYNDGNSSQWVIAVNAGAFLQPASTTVLGGVKVDGTTIKAAVDGTISAPIFMGDNRIINGDMRIDQRNNGASGTANGYTVDRWGFNCNIVGKITWGRNLASIPSTPSFPCMLGFQGGGATYAPLAADYFFANQVIEADMISDFAWGSASAQPVTLSFWAYSNFSGNYSGAIRNAVHTRSYPFSFALAAGAWTKIVVTVPGDTGGTWVLSGAGGAVEVAFNLGSGSSNLGSANVWGASFVGVTGAASPLANANGGLWFTGVKLEIGSVATPFNRQSLAKSMADCQRYYQTGQIINTSYVVGGGDTYTSMSLPVCMRSAPTTVGTPISPVNIGAINIGTYGGSVIWFHANAIATGAVQVGCTFTASAEL